VLLLAIEVFWVTAGLGIMRLRVYSALFGCSGAALGWCSTRRHLRLHESNQWGLRSMQQPSLRMLQPVR
jgi:hypothetical protein